MHAYNIYKHPTQQKSWCAEICWLYKWYECMYMCVCGVAGCV